MSFWGLAFYKTGILLFERAAIVFNRIKMIIMIFLINIFITFVGALFYYQGAASNC